LDMQYIYFGFLLLQMKGLPLSYQEQRIIGLRPGW